jgi:hypothetical protein
MTIPSGEMLVCEGGDEFCDSNLSYSARSGSEGIVIGDRDQLTWVQTCERRVEDPKTNKAVALQDFFVYAYSKGRPGDLNRGSDSQ